MLENDLIGLNGVIVGCAFVNLEYRATVSYAANDLSDLLMVDSSSRISLSVCKWWVNHGQKPTIQQTYNGLYSHPPGRLIVDDSWPRTRWI